MSRRVVVTGVGPVSSIGVGKERFWDSAVSGRGYFRNTDFPDVDLEQYRSRVCSPVDGFDLSAYIEDSRPMRRAGLATKYSVVGSLLALRDAGFRVEPAPAGQDRIRHFRVQGLDPLRTGVILGQAVPNADLEYPEHVKFIRDRGPQKVNPFTLPQTNQNRGATAVAEWFYLKGSGLTVTTACASATHAIGLAAFHIMHGIEDVMVTGGAEAAIDSYVFSGFDIMKALSRRNHEPGRASRPFDRQRDGFVLGEGAGIIILEELEHARRRDASVYGEVRGFGFSQDAYNIVSPDPRGEAAILAVRRALDMAQVLPGEVEYINAHGTSTVVNDPNESYIIKQVFGEHAYRIPISSSKSYFGHPLGAAGGLESIVTLMVMERGVVAPTANLEDPDTDFVDSAAPELDKRCDLDYVPLKAREQQVGVAVNESFGFGGQNGVLVFSSI
ncbi:MAG: beta-ketoacyl-[acyl-carrier-protein] synthase family protein [Spirochaetota bacterium]